LDYNYKPEKSLIWLLNSNEQEKPKTNIILKILSNLTSKLIERRPICIGWVSRYCTVYSSFSLSKQSIVKCSSNCSW